MPHALPSLDLPDPPHAWEAIARYFAGECTDVEAAGVRNWLAARPEDERLALELDRVAARLGLHAPSSAIDVESALRRVIARRDRPLVRSIARPRLRVLEHPQPQWRTMALRAAAAILVTVGGALLWQRGGADDAPATIAETSYVTRVGQRDSLRLPDGSRVVLGPESRLVVAAGYGDSVRRVELEGEAYFDVLHDDARPFTVVADGAAVRDIGTAFTVRTLEGGVRVVVTSGSVLLHPAQSGDDRGVVLHEGDVGSLDASGRTAVERGAASSDDIAWMDGRLVFREAPLRSVIAEVHRWYGIDLRLADSTLANRHLTASFSGEPAERVLTVIGLALGGTVERRGENAVVRSVSSERRQ